jgi:hypothetical protein
MRIELGLICAVCSVGPGLALAEVAPYKEQAPPPPETPTTAEPESGARTAEPAAPAASTPEQSAGSEVHPEATATAARLKTEPLTPQNFWPDEKEKLWDLRTSMLFMERTHFAIVPFRLSHQYSDAYGERPAPLVFDATAALHLPVYNRLSELLAYDAPGRYYTRVPYFSLSFVPTVRMSRPTLDVLTPSYRVGFNAQWFLQHSRLRGNPDHVAVHGLRLSIAHYSNGQGGCSFAKGQPDDGSSATCQAAYDAARAGQSGTWYRRNVDQHAGSFSTNYLTLAYHARYVSLRNARPDSDGLRAETSSITGGLLVNGVIGALNGDGQQDLYPLINARVETRGERVLNSRGYPVRLSAEGFVEGYFLDQRRRFGSNAYIPWRAGAEAAVTFPKINDLGLFAAVSGGQDPYNIHFMQRATWIQLGLVIDLFPRPRYGSGRLERAKTAADEEATAPHS